VNSDAVGALASLTKLLKPPENTNTASGSGVSAVLPLTAENKRQRETAQRLISLSEEVRRLKVEAVKHRRMVSTLKEEKKHGVQVCDYYMYRIINYYYFFIPVYCCNKLELK
jgi:hypothetical protein